MSLAEDFPIYSYEEYDEYNSICLHEDKIERKGQLICLTCGKVYNETTLEWE